MRRRQRLLLLAVALGATLLGLVVHATGALRRTELDTVDARFAVRGERPPPRDVLLVVIDERTIQALAKRYPFPRRYHARAMDLLHDAGARVIAYDVTFVEPTTEEDDGRLLDALDRDRPVLLAATAVDDHGRTNVLGDPALVREVGARVGSVLVPLDPGGVYRRVPRAVHGLPHFGVVAAEMADGRPIPAARIGGDEAWIDFAGPAGTYPRVSFIDVLRGRVPRERLRGRVVIVGASLPTVPDAHPTSTTGGGGQMSGMEVLANAMDTVRRGAPLRATSSLVEILLVLLLPLAVPLLGLRVSPLRATTLAVAAGLAYLVATQVAFQRGVILPVMAPTIAVGLAAAGGLAVHYLGATVEREHTRAVFSRFVPEDVVGDVLARTDDDLRLEGERLDATVMFADLREFTTWAETRQPEEVIEVLNHHLEEMTDAIMDHGGTLVSYMGDGIMAVFGAPLPQPDHADRALSAAREMLDVRLPRVNAWLARRGLGAHLRMGVGLNSGPVMSGNVGSSRRVEYAAVGDTTNTAARLEAMTKGTPHQLLVADSTRRRLHEIDGLAPAGEVDVRGREGRVIVWAPAHQS